jgi:hypothetical protein
MHAWPKGKTTDYVGYVLPLGYPQTSLICGRCDNAGVIWVNKDEVSAYQNGQRVFNGPNNFARMKADDSGVKTGRDELS